MSEHVNHPAHYAGGGIEAIDVIDAWQLDFAMGNALKYIARADLKGNPEEDIRKAIWYLRHELALRHRAAAKG